MSTVESEAYKPHVKHGSLDSSWRFRDYVISPSNFFDLPQLAQEMGFVRVDDFPTKRAKWRVYDRPNHDVPNFPDWATRITSTLAVYDIEGNQTHAILRTSQEPYLAEEFSRDLVTFTKHFIERPRLLGYPSRELTRFRNLFPALAIGMVTLSVADYFFVQSAPGSLMNLGTIMGELGGPAVYVALWAHSERHARRSISNLELYTAGEMARNTLVAERDHNVRVDVQNELYQTLKQNRVDLTPDQFLNQIYAQLPQVLVYRRYAEVKKDKYSRVTPPGEIGNSFPKLLEVSNTLLSA